MIFLELRFVTGATYPAIKILVATDNHIGYAESDPIRGQDSINTFREILQLAVEHEVSKYYYDAIIPLPQFF
jgi:hypothetical protein